MQGDGDIKRREDTRRKNIRPTSTLFVVNFNVEDTRDRDLERHFEKYGRLVRVQIKRTYAFVQYEEVEQAEAAMKETHLSRFMGELYIELVPFPPSLLPFSPILGPLSAEGPASKALLSDEPVLSDAMAMQVNGNSNYLAPALSQNLLMTLPALR